MRKASEAPFPYGYPGLVCYIELRDGEMSQCFKRDDLREAVRRGQAKVSRLFAVWPGQYASDLFVIDDLDALASKVGVD